MKVSPTTLYYRSHRAAREKKKAYDAKYGATEERKDYRVELNRERRRRHLKGNAKDLSHQKDGSMVLESRHLNRKRNGSNGRSTLK